jgi:hypothetical protein
MLRRSMWLGEHRGRAQQIEQIHAALERHSRAGGNPILRERSKQPPADGSGNGGE